jgi:cation:H+ antiporter
VILTILAVVAGVAGLAFAADQFVVGAARVALLRQIPALVVGVVIIGFGTSAPELIVSTFAAAGGQPEIAVGNVVGSNIANLSLLLGVGALIVPLAVDSRTVRREAPLVVVAVSAFGLVVQGGGIDREEGAVLLLAMVVALWAVSQRGADDAPADPLGPETAELVGPEAHRLGVEVGRTILGLLGTIASAQALLWGATDLADRAGLAEGFVGATMVAIGTSLPELVTVVQSARRGETDLIVGNLLGSNLFNSLAVGGMVGLVGGRGLDAPTLTGLASIAAVVVAVVALATMVTGHTVRRAEGTVLVVGYAALVPFLA